MIKIKDGPIVYADVDDTLVLWTQEHVPEDEIDTSLILIKDSMGDVGVWPHKKHIEMLRHFNARGHTVAVWSQGGSDWAEAVVKALHLEDIVDIILPKPYWFIDDISSDMFMTEKQRIWIDPKHQKISRIKPNNWSPLGEGE